MTTYNVLTTIVASGLAEQPHQARLESARAKGYSVAQLGPGSAQPQEEELLETWLLLEVRGRLRAERGSDSRNRRIRKASENKLCMMSWKDRMNGRAMCARWVVHPCICCLPEQWVPCRC